MTRYRRQRQTSWQCGEAGATLIEVLVATAVLVTAVMAIAQLFLIAAATNASARHVTTASILAAQKVEQLRALLWGFDAAGLRVSDTSSDTSVTPESPVGGTGLQPSPSDSLVRDVGGYVDHLDAFGRIVGNRGLPSTAVYTRRWWIQPLPGDGDALEIHVVVSRREHARRSMQVEAQMISVRARKPL